VTATARISLAVTTNTVATETATLLKASMRTA